MTSPNFDPGRQSAGPPAAVVLAGGPGTSRCPLSNIYPSLLFPVVDGRPLVTHLVEFLHASGIRSIGFSLSEGIARRDELEAAIEAAARPGLEIHTRVDSGTRGPAGALKDMQSFTQNKAVLVLPSHLWPEPFDVETVWAAHRKGGAPATIVLESGVRARADLEQVSLEADGLLRGVSILHESRDHRRRLRSSGIYVFEPEILDHIESNDYIDIREQLLPDLQERGLRVQGFVLERPLTRTDDIASYLALNRRLLLEDLYREEASTDSRETDPGIHIADSAKVDPSALIIGPVSIGEGCEIGANARILGPVMLCEGTRVAPSAMVRDSIVWARGRIGEGARVEYSLLTHDCHVAASQRVAGNLLDCGQVLEDRLNQVAHSGLSMLAAGAQGVVRDVVRRRARRDTYLSVKRAMDLLLPLAAAPALLPLFALIALAIRLDSPGPIFYSQRRCGKDGREFGMLKFRTMVRDADRIHAELVAQSDSSGPMFKMDRDPRITRVGRLLRRTSLDELPQLICVLMGHMSLVGPRPLRMDEMEYAPRWRDIRLRVKPGLTGLWQVNGRSTLGFDGWVENDIRYVRNQSLALDLRILGRTLAAVLRGTGAV